MPLKLPTLCFAQNSSDENFAFASISARFPFDLLDRQRAQLFLLHDLTLLYEQLLGAFDG
jgi:hypothetical protein